MNQAIQACEKRRRLDAENQSRSDAINRTLTDAQDEIRDLKAELFATRLAGGIAAVALGAVMIRNALECVL